jgi:hypothetical protein
MSATPTITATPAAAVATVEILPSAAALLQASRIAMQEDRPIQVDYYADTATKKAFLGEDPTTKERLLVKSADEFTSLVQRIFKAGDDYIITTENSLYIVSNKIQKRRINMAQLHGTGGLGE